MDPLAREIDRLATGIAALRIVYLLHHQRGTDMAQLIEIKGLGADLAAAKAGIKGVRGGVKDVSISAGLLTAELKDVHTQLESARDDLRFEAETLGNGGGTGSNQSGQQEQQQKQDPKSGSTTNAAPARDPQTGDVVVAHGAEATIVGLEPVKP